MGLFGPDIYDLRKIVDLNDAVKKVNSNERLAYMKKQEEKEKQVQDKLKSLSDQLKSLGKESDVTVANWKQKRSQIDTIKKDIDDTKKLAIDAGYDYDGNENVFLNAYLESLNDMRQQLTPVYVETICKENVERKEKYLKQVEKLGDFQKMANINKHNADELKNIEPTLEDIVSKFRKIAFLGLGDYNKMKIDPNGLAIGAELDAEQLLSQAMAAVNPLISTLDALPVPKIPGLAELSDLISMLMQMAASSSNNSQSAPEFPTLPSLPSLSDRKFPDIPPGLMKQIKDIEDSLKAIAMQLPMMPVKLFLMMFEVVTSLIGLPFIGDVANLIPMIMEFPQTVIPKIEAAVKQIVKKKIKEIMDMSVPPIPSAIPPFPIGYMCSKDSVSMAELQKKMEEVAQKAKNAAAKAKNAADSNAPKEDAPAPQDNPAAGDQDASSVHKEAEKKRQCVTKITSKITSLKTGDALAYANIVGINAKNYKKVQEKLSKYSEYLDKKILPKYKKDDPTATILYTGAYKADGSEQSYMKISDVTDLGYDK